MDPPAPLELWTDSGPVTAQLSGIRSYGKPEYATISVVTSNTNPGFFPRSRELHLSQSVADVIVIPTGVPGTVIIPITVSDLQPANNSTNYALIVKVRKANQFPTIDKIDDLMVFNSDTEPITIPLSGISDGDADEIQELSITAWSDSPDLLRDPEVVFTGASSVTQLLLRPFAGAIGRAEVTVEVDDGQSRNSTASRTFYVQLEQPVNRMAAVVGHGIVSRGQRAAIDLIVHSTTQLTNFSATLRDPAKQLSDLSATAAAPEIDPASLLLVPLADGVWRLTMATRPGQALTYVRNAALLHFLVADEGPSSFVPVQISDAGGWAAGGVLIMDWNVSDGEVVVLGAEPLLKVCTAPNGLRLCLYGLPFATYRIECLPGGTLGGSWSVLHDNLQVLDAPIELELALLEPVCFFRAVQIQ
jgi:hypothetical protein